MLEIADETWHSKNDGLKLIFVLDEQKAKSSFDTKQDETEDEMSQFSDYKEEFLWVEYNE